MSQARIGINGFGRMGRLALRAAWDRPDLELTHVNEVEGNAETAAHLLMFDSVHGRWPHEVSAGDGLEIDGTGLGYSDASELAMVPGPMSTSCSNALEGFERLSRSTPTSRKE